MEKKDRKKLIKIISELPQISEWEKQVETNVDPLFLGKGDTEVVVTHSYSENSYRFVVEETSFCGIDCAIYIYQDKSCLYEDAVYPEGHDHFDCFDDCFSLAHQAFLKFALREFAKGDA